MSAEAADPAVTESETREVEALSDVRGPVFRWVYHTARLIFGAWWLFSGMMHFFWPELQPLGDEPAAIDFTLALMASGLFDWIKVLEIVLGLTLLANRAMPLTIIALVPINVVIVYWNFVLDEGIVEWTFGALTIVFNAILAWPWRRHFWPLFVWRAEGDYSAASLISTGDGNA